MNLLRMLQIATAVTACLGTAMLGLSERNYALVAAAVVVSAAAYYFSDRRGAVQLGTWASNFASLGALAVAGLRYYTLTSDDRVLAVADLMGYLQFILQFRPKTVRNLWLLIVVSFLQVSVAAALHTGVVFALLLVVYLFSAVFFLALFYLHREQLRFDELATKHLHAAEVQGAGFYARPLVGPATLHAWRELSQRILNLGVGTLVMAAFFFVAVPRIGQSNWMPAAMVAGRTVGFSAEINLTRSGQIVEDPEVVMQVKFFDVATNLPFQPDFEPYFRGTSLTYYANGRWRGSGGRPRLVMVPSPPSDRSSLVRQQIAIEPLFSPTLFACAPWFSDEADERLGIAVQPLQLFRRRESDRSNRFTYNVLTSAFRNHREIDLLPLPEELEDSSRFLHLPSPGPRQTDPLANLKQIAAGVVAGIPPNEVERRCKALEAYLRDSGRFQYTLQSPERPDDVDPLEDFVTENPRGHCEYFAGAMVLMLRSVGIPSRIVVGYRGGDWNVVGSFYQVRQLNAHSWVEAYLPPEDVPLKRLNNPELMQAAARYGAWLRLDPTTADDDIALADGNSRWGEIQQVVDYLKFMWNNYVVGMDADKQREAVYQPLTENLRRAYAALTDRETWLSLWRGVAGPASSQQGQASGSSPSRRRELGVVAVSFVVGAAAVAWRRRRRGRRTPELATRKNGRAVEPVDFYVQLEKVLAKQNLRRSPEQTQREFIQAACGELAESPTTRTVAMLPRSIVEAFYRVRFGAAALSDSERREVDQALATLAVTLVQSPGGATSGQR